MDEYMEPMKCDWCDAKYERSYGTNLMGDELCPKCADIVDKEEF